MSCISGLKTKIRWEKLGKFNESKTQKATQQDDMDGWMDGWMDDKDASATMCQIEIHRMKECM